MSNPRLATNAMPTAKLTDKYQFISTQDIVSACESMGLIIRAESAARVRKVDKIGYQKHSVIMGEVNETPVVGGSALRVIITNDHTGGGSIKVQVGLYRFVCTNGLVVGSHLMEPIRFRHVKRNINGQELQEYIIGKVQDMISHFYDVVKARIDMMTQVQLTPEQQAGFASAAARLLSNNGVSNLVNDAQLLDARRADDMQSDLWTVFNRIQENGMLGGQDRQVPEGRRRIHSTSRAIRGMARAHRFNEELFDLAASYLPMAA